MIEVLIALSVLILGAMLVLRTFGYATITNQLTKENVIATNLAREGLEAVRNIRDTNWLRYAGERRICWNNNDTTDCRDTDFDRIPDTPIKNKKAYRAEFDTNNYRWLLAFDPSSTTRLNLNDGVSASEEFLRLKRDSTTGQYYHTSSIGAGIDSIYFREIYTEYLDNIGAAPALDESANVLRVTSRVQWLDRGKVSEVTLTTIITDYLGRNNHN